MKSFIIATLAGAAYAQYNVSATVPAITATTEYATGTTNKSVACNVKWDLRSNSQSNTSKPNSNTSGTYAKGDTTYTSTWEQTQECKFSDSFYNETGTEVEYFICLSSKFPGAPVASDKQSTYVDAVFEQGCRYWKWIDNQVTYQQSASRPSTYPVVDATGSFDSKFSGTSSKLVWGDSTTSADPYLASYCNSYNTANISGNEKCLDWTFSGTKHSVDIDGISTSKRTTDTITIGGLPQYVKPSEDETVTNGRYLGVDLNGQKSKWSNDGKTATAVNFGTAIAIVWGPPDAWTANQSHVRTSIPVVKMTDTLVQSGISFKVDSAWTKTKLSDTTMGVPSGVTQRDATAETSEILV